MSDAAAGAASPLAAFVPETVLDPAAGVVPPAAGATAGAVEVVASAAGGLTGPIVVEAGTVVVVAGAVETSGVVVVEAAGVEVDAPTGGALPVAGAVAAPELSGTAGALASGAL